jgi:hypothetical protein
MVAELTDRLGKVSADQATAARERNAPILAEMSAAGFPDQALAISQALTARIAEGAPA